jgi:hypothetical protein
MSDCKSLVINITNTAVDHQIMSKQKAAGIMDGITLNEFIKMLLSYSESL